MILYEDTCATLYTGMYLTDKDRVGHYRVTCDQTSLISVFNNMSGTRTEDLIS